MQSTKKKHDFIGRIDGQAKVETIAVSENNNSGGVDTA